MEKLVQKIIKENKELFSKQEMKIIRDNSTIIKKVYIIGLMNGRQIYKE